MSTIPEGAKEAARRCMQEHWGCYPREDIIAEAIHGYNLRVLEHLKAGEDILRRALTLDSYKDIAEWLCNKP